MLEDSLQFLCDVLSHLLSSTLVAVQISREQDTRLSLLLSPSPSELSGHLMKFTVTGNTSVPAVLNGLPHLPLYLPVFILYKAFVVYQPIHGVVHVFICIWGEP